MLKANLANVNSKIKDIKSKMEKILFGNISGKPFGDIKLPFETFKTDFSSDLQEYNRNEFKKLYPDFEEALAHEFKALNFIELIKKEYQYESVRYSDKTIKYITVKERIAWLRKLNADAWWDELKKNTDNTNHKLLDRLKQQFKDITKDQEIYVLLSTITLKKLHEQYVHILNQVTCELAEIDHIKDELSTATLEKWKHYLLKLKNELITEKEKIERVAIRRIQDTSSYRASLSQDDTIYLYRQEVEHNPEFASVKHLFNIPFKTKLTNTKEDAEKNIIKYSMLPNTGLPRCSLNRDSFQYFFPFMPIESFKTYVDAFMPEAIMKHVETSGAWEKLPKFLTTGRRIRANFIVNQLYDVMDLSIQTSYFTKHHSDEIKHLDNPNHEQFINSAIHLENKYKQLIERVEQAKPSGLWAWLFNRETRQLFEEYKDWLSNERNNTQKIKENYINKLNDFSSDKKIIINDMQSIANLRDCLTIHHISADRFFAKTDFMEELIDELFKKQAGVMNGKQIKALIKLTSSFTKNEEQKQALLLLEKILSGDNLNEQVSNNLKNKLSSLVKNQDELNILWKKIFDHYIDPRSSTIVNGLITQLNLGWDKIKPEMRNELIECYQCLNAQHSYVVDVYSVDYLKNFIDHIKNHLVKLTTAEIENGFEQLIKVANNRELDFLYQIKLSKLYLDSPDKVNEFITASLEQMPKLSLSDTDINLFISIVKPYQYNWHQQQVRLIESFCGKSHLQNYHSEWLQTILNYTVNDDEKLIISPLPKAYSVEELLTFYGKENYIKLINDFETSLNQSLHPALFNIIRLHIPLGMEETLATDDPTVADKIEMIRKRIVDKEIYYRLRSLYDTEKNSPNFKTKLTTLIAEIKITCQNYPLTLDGKNELNQLIGCYDPRQTRAQLLLIQNFGFGNDMAKKDYYTAWIKDNFLNNSKKMIDILPAMLTASEIKSLYNPSGNFFHELYSQIHKYIEMPAISAEVLTLIKKHLPEGLADEFKEEPIIHALILSCQASLNETEFLSELALQQEGSVEQIKTFITKWQQKSHEVKLADGVLKFKQIIEKNILPYDDKRYEQQRLLLNTFAPEYLPLYHRQWLTGLVTGEHCNAGLSAISNTSNMKNIALIYGKTEFITEIIPMIYQYLKQHRGIPKDVKTVILNHLPNDMKDYYSKEDYKTVKKMINRIKRKLKKVVLIDGRDEDHNATLTSIRTTHLQENNANMEKAIRDIVNFTKIVTANSFPKTSSGKQAFHDIIKYVEGNNEIIYDDKWSRQQSILIEAYAPEYVPAFNDEWLIKVLAGNKNDDDLNPLKSIPNPTIDDLQRIYGKENLPKLLIKIKEYISDKKNRDEYLVSFLALHFPDHIEETYPELELGQLKCTLIDLTFINQLDYLSVKKKSLDDVQLFIDTMKKTNPDQFQIPGENDDLFNAHLSFYQPQWSEQQKLVLTSFKICEKQLTKFNQDWFRGLLRGEHQQVNISPINAETYKETYKQVLASYGLTDTAGFLQLFSTDIHQCLKSSPGENILKLIEIHLKGLDGSDAVKTIQAEIQTIYKHSSVKDDAFKLLNEYNQYNLVEKIQLLENQLALHKNSKDETKYLLVKTALENLPDATVKKMTTAIINKDFHQVKALYAAVMNPNLSTAYFTAKDKIINLYTNYKNIYNSWTILQKYISSIENLKKSSQSELDFLLNNDFIPQDLFKYLDEIPEEQRKVAAKLITANEYKFDKILPLNKYHQAIRDRLLNGSSFETSKDWEYMTCLNDFKLIIAYITTNQSKFSLNLNDPKDKQIFDASLNRLIQSPYSYSKHRETFWENIFSQYLMKDKNWLDDKESISKLNQLAKLIDPMASPDQRLSFPVKAKSVKNSENPVDQLVLRRNASGRALRAPQHMKVVPKQLKNVAKITSSFFHKQRKLISDSESIKRHKISKQ